MRVRRHYTGRSLDRTETSLGDRVSIAEQIYLNGVTTDLIAQRAFRKVFLAEVEREMSPTAARRVAERRGWLSSERKVLEMVQSMDLFEIFGILVEMISNRLERGRAAGTGSKHNRAKGPGNGRKKS